MAMTRKQDLDFTVEDPNFYDIVDSFLRLQCHFLSCVCSYESFILLLKTEDERSGPDLDKYYKKFIPIFHTDFSVLF